MVAGTQQQQVQSQQKQLHHPNQQQQPLASASSAQDEALKRNTDCVYFLASPLTCKKGSECEYRHSEYARVNPRDCWFWLNGNCLNPKCSFRHPPLDGLLGTQASNMPGPSANTPGPSLPTAQVGTTSATNAPYNSTKQSVPCIFFQKGFCIKGDKCAFLHGPNSSTSYKVVAVPEASQSTEPFNGKKAFGSLEKCMQEKKIPHVNILKLSAASSEVKPAAKVESAWQQCVGVDKYIPLPMGSDDVASRLKFQSSLPVSNENSVVRSDRPHHSNITDDHSMQNGGEVDEFLRESSPGFDVLVDNELRASDYYHGDDQFRRTRGLEGRNLDGVNENHVGNSADYNSLDDIDHESFHNSQGYDSYNHMQGPYAWERHRASSERMLGGSTHQDRRSYLKSDTSESIDASDLRHRLSKHRRVDGLRSVVSHEYAPDGQGEEQSYRTSRKDSLPLRESSLSNRLRGRIKLPAISSVNGGDDYWERESGRGMTRSRLSPGRPRVSSNQGRLRDRIQGRVQDGYNNEGKNFRGQPLRIEDDGNMDFAGPKSLAELKGLKSIGSNKEQQSLGKRSRLEDNQQCGDELPFDGPKPLSEILKKKREAGASAPALQNCKSSDNKKETEGRQNEEIMLNGLEIETQGGLMPMVNEDSKSVELIDKTATDKTTNSIGRVTNRSDAHGQSSEVGELQPEDGYMDEETMEEGHEFEGEYEEGEGDYYYEQEVDERGLNYEEGDNGDEEGEYAEEDGDDFAKKIGVMFS